MCVFVQVEYGRVKFVLGFIANECLKGLPFRYLEDQSLDISSAQDWCDKVTSCVRLRFKNSCRSNQIHPSCSKLCAM